MKHDAENARVQLARRVANGNESMTQNVAQWELVEWQRLIESGDAEIQRLKETIYAETAEHEAAEAELSAKYRLFQCCPICNGAGTVSRPPHVAGDVETWSASATAAYTCRSCSGTGLVRIPSPLSTGGT